MANAFKPLVTKTSPNEEEQRLAGHPVVPKAAKRPLASPPADRFKKKKPPVRRRGEDDEPEPREPPDADVPEHRPVSARAVLGVSMASEAELEQLIMNGIRAALAVLHMRVPAVLAPSTTNPADWDTTKLVSLALQQATITGLPAAAFASGIATLSLSYVGSMLDLNGLLPATPVTASVELDFSYTWAVVWEEAEADPDLARAQALVAAVSGALPPDRHHYERLDFAWTGPGSTRVTSPSLPGPAGSAAQTAIENAVVSLIPKLAAALTAAYSSKPLVGPLRSIADYFALRFSHGTMVAVAYGRHGVIDAVYGINPYTVYTEGAKGGAVDTVQRTADALAPQITQAGPFEFRLLPAGLDELIQDGLRKTLKNEEDVSFPSKSGLVEVEDGLIRVSIDFVYDIRVDDVPGTAVIAFRFECDEFNRPGLSKPELDVRFSDDVELELDILAGIGAGLGVIGFFAAAIADLFTAFQFGLARSVLDSKLMTSSFGILDQGAEEFAAGEAAGHIPPLPDAPNPSPASSGISFEVTGAVARQALGLVVKTKAVQVANPPGEAEYQSDPERSYLEWLPSSIDVGDGIARPLVVRTSSGTVRLDAEFADIGHSRLSIHDGGIEVYTQPRPMETRSQIFDLNSTTLDFMHQVGGLTRSDSPIDVWMDLPAPRMLTEQTSMPVWFLRRPHPDGRAEWIIVVAIAGALAEDFIQAVREGIIATWDRRHKADHDSSRVGAGRRAGAAFDEENEQEAPSEAKSTRRKAAIKDAQEEFDDNWSDRRTDETNDLLSEWIRNLPQLYLVPGAFRPTFRVIALLPDGGAQAAVEITGELSGFHEQVTFSYFNHPVGGANTMSGKPSPRRSSGLGNAQPQGKNASGKQGSIPGRRNPGAALLGDKEPAKPAPPPKRIVRGVTTVDTWDTLDVDVRVTCSGLLAPISCAVEIGSTTYAARLDSAAFPTRTGQGGALTVSIVFFQLEFTAHYHRQDSDGAGGRVVADCTLIDNRGFVLLATAEREFVGQTSHYETFMPMRQKHPLRTIDKQNKPSKVPIKHERPKPKPINPRAARERNRRK